MNARFNSTRIKPYLLLGLFLSLIGLSLIASSAQSSQPANLKKSPDGLWEDVDETSLRSSTETQKQGRIPTVYRTVQLNQSALKQLLATAPMEFTEAAKAAPVVMTLPLPDGTFARFSIQESAMMSPGLAEKLPQIKTYSGRGIDDPTATVRFDWTPAGFHAMILSTGDTIYIDPYSKGDTKNYISFSKQDLKRDASRKPKCFWKPASRLTPAVGEANVQQTTTTLRTLRLALAATGEYSEFYGGTKEGALAGITTTINRVNSIYERELAIRLVLIDREMEIIYTDGDTDPYTNDDAGMQTDENQANLDKVIGDANYDMGHVFSTASGGVGGAGPCITGQKAIGATGLPMPRGDAFDVDFVAHEMIHQFDGGHTFNASGGDNCNDQNRSPMSAYEPGSGSTVASYAGTCECADYQQNSDDYFNGNSIDEFQRYFANIGQFGGVDCSRKIATGNRPPTVIEGLTVNIPANTPFTLTAMGSDPDGDAITYSWEQYDLGTASSCLPDTDDGSRPIFRSFRPKISPSRTFPSTNPPPPGESLPTTTRTMNFRCTVRDGKGGVAKASAKVNVTARGEAFAVTSFKKPVAWLGGSTQTITWDVGQTNTAPINCTAVRILLSTDGGQTFPVTLVENAPNTGSARVKVPTGISTTTQARIKVEAVGNIFFSTGEEFTISR
jgi:hypothetical protein